MGVLNQHFAKPSICNGLAIISRSHNDLAFSDLRRRLPAFASFSIAMTLEMELDIGIVVACLGRLEESVHWLSTIRSGRAVGL